MGNTCKPMAVSFQCMTKSTTIKKKKERKKEIWHQIIENVQQAIRQGKNIPIDFWPLRAFTEAAILPFQGNSSSPDVQQQAEHLLNEY